MSENLRRNWVVCIRSRLEPSTLEMKLDLLSLSKILWDSLKRIETKPVP